MNTDLMFSSNTNEWTTPQALFEELDKEFHFTLDPCCTHVNAKCKKHYTIAEDGLHQSWANEIVFCNPPYGRHIKHWVKKCHDEAMNGATVVLLIASRTDTAYFHDYIYDKAELRFIRGRVKFGGSDHNAPFPSMLAIYRKSEDERLEQIIADELNKALDKLFAAYPIITTQEKQQ